MYREHFHHPPEIPSLRTADLDFLIPNPPNIRKEVNVSWLLQQTGFDLLTDYISGYTKYSHPTLDVEFLIPELGRGRNAPYSIPQLHINAQGLRYLTMLQHHVMSVFYHDMPVNVPEAAAYVLHKYLVSQERAKAGKREKDLKIAGDLGEFLLHHSEQREKLHVIFHELPSKWQKTLHRILAMSGNLPLLDLLTSNFT